MYNKLEGVAESGLRQFLITKQKLLDDMIWMDTKGLVLFR